MTMDEERASGLSVHATGTAICSLGAERRGRVCHVKGTYVR